MKRSPGRRKRNRTPHQVDPQSPEHQERMLDEALEDTFPASDPPAQTQPHDTSPGARDAPRRPAAGKKSGE
jgi:hypothetical protein